MADVHLDAFVAVHNERALGHLGREYGKVRREVDETSDSFDDMATVTKRLDADIARSTETVRQYGLTWERTRSRVDAAQFVRAQRELARLQRMSKMLTAAGPSARHDIGGGSWGPGSWDFSKTMSESRGMFIQGGVALAAANAPILAGVISTAISGAVAGGLTAGGGILAAIRSERVQSSWKELGKDILATLDPVVAQFETPMVRAAERFGQAFVAARIPSTLSASAALMPTLADGLADVVESLGPGFEAAAKRGKPALKGLLGGVTDVGEGVSLMLDDFADVGPEAAMAFRDATHALSMFVGETGDAIQGLTRMYEITRAPLMVELPFTGGMRGVDLIPWTGLLGVIGKIDDASNDAARSQDKLGDEFKDAADAAAEQRDRVRELYEALNDLFDPRLDTQREKFRLAQMVRDLPGQLAEGDSIDDMMAINDAVRQAIEARDALASIPGADINQVNQWYDNQIKKIKDIGVAADITKLQLDQLTDPFTVSITLDVASNVASDALKMVLKMAGAGGPAPSGGTPTAPSSGGGGGGMWGDFGSLLWGGARASGGTVMAGRAYWVGERGPEPFIPHQNGYIMDNASAMSAMRGGTQRVELVVTAGGGGDFENMLAEMVRRYVRVSHGGNVATGLGRRKR